MSAISNQRVFNVARKVTRIISCSKGDETGCGPYRITANSDGWFYYARGILAPFFWSNKCGDLEAAVIHIRCKKNKAIMKRVQHEYI